MRQILIFFLIFLISELFAQDTIYDPYEMNLYQLSKTKVVTVSKELQGINILPASVKIITSHEITEQGYFTLEDVLADLPGFQFRNILGLNSYVFQRGVPNQNNLILVMVDGVLINELNSGGFYGGGHYNLSNVDHIEIVYGPASALYGTNAVSGIINIITKNPEANKGISFDFLAGSFKTFNTNTSYNYFSEEKKLGINISAMYKTSEKADLSGSDGDYNWTDSMDNFEDDYAFDFKISKNNLTAGLNYQNRQSSVSTYYPSVGTNYQDYGTLWNIMFLNTYLKYLHDINQKSKISNTLYYRNSTVLDNSVREIVDTAQFGYYRPNYLIGNDVFCNYNLSDNINILGGMLFEYESLAKNYAITQSNSSLQPPPTPENPEMLNNLLVSTYLQSQFRFLKNFYFFAGFRYDYSSFYNHVFTPRLALLFDYNKINLKFLYLNAFRAPKPWDYTSGLGNSNLMPEKMNSFEFISTFYFTNNLFVELDLYKNLINEALEKEFVGNSFRWVNQGQINTDGLEMTFGFKKSFFTSNLNYTFNNSYDEENIEIYEIAKHSANAVFSFDFLEYFNGSLRINYLGKRKNPQFITSTGSEYIDDAIVVNTAFSLLEYKNINIQLIVKNVLDAEYYHTSNLLPERYRQPQQTFLIKIGLKF